MRAVRTLLSVAVAIPATVAMLAGPAVPAGAAGTVQVVSTDTLSNSLSQHQTEVEPGTFANGSTVVSAFQVGRIFDGGAGAIGWATSTDGGSSWSHGLLPGLTQAAPSPGPYQRGTDASVAYDAAHGQWLVATLAMNGTPGVAVTVNRSSDGQSWGNAIVAATKGSNLDKSWIVCDDTSTSPFYGHCYIEYDDFGNGDLIYNATSTDGGLTWSTPSTTADSALGLGGQPVVQPNGTVIVPFDNGAEAAIMAYRSTDGGQTWSATVPVTVINHHTVHAGLRDGKLPSAAIDGGGTVYLAWEDCRFRRRCSSNDIVVATSSDGVTWSAPTRVPIDATSSTVDHFIPGIAVDRTTSGASAHLSVTYYFYPVAACRRSTCQLEVGQISSTAGLGGWGTPATLTSSPMQVNWLASTTQGYMVGDYISTSYVSGHPIGAFAVATAPDSVLHESTAAGGA
ncbi:MAG: exo-alpha-sialidase [Acidimicrobiia bacterium]|nr:exo-alpha-sialidase [Acidimicrobiia bacterium]